MRKILVLSYYFPPDLSAGSFRTKALIDELLSYDVQITLICSSPNRYASYKKETKEYESCGNLEIYRVKVPFVAKGIISQAASYCVFTIKTFFFILKHRDFSLIYATSSRLMTAFLGSLVSKVIGSPLYLDIRDLFRDTMNDIFPKPVTLFLDPIIKIAENFSFRSAFKINIVSGGFKEYIQNACSPRTKISTFTNGIDNIFLETDFKRNDKLDEKKTILYAGNIGDGQALHKIIPELSNSLGSSFKIKIIGDGSRKYDLIEGIKKLCNQSVEFFPPMDRVKLIKEYKSSDILFLHLDNKNAFKRVLPSKIFEYAATGKPIAAGLSGYSRQFILNNIENVNCFEPNNVYEAKKSILNLDYKNTNRSKFKLEFSREIIMQKMARDIIDSI